MLRLNEPRLIAGEAMRWAGRRARMRAANTGAGDPELAAVILTSETRASRQRARLRRWLNGERPSPAAAAPGTILERHDVTPDLVVFRLARPQGLVFEPGQYLKMGLDGARRSYSIASAPTDPFVELCIERVAGGRLTSRLWELRPGDAVELSDRAKGKLTLGPGRFHLMAATVTGVSPFASMLRQHVPERKHRFVLLHGARRAAELVLRSELEALAAAHPEHFTYLPSVTQPEAGYEGLTGRVTAHLAAARSHFSEPPVGYACGHPDMVRDVASALADLEVRTEAYWS